MENEEFNRFKVGTGFSKQQRIDFWNNPTLCIGKTARIRFQPEGTKDKPRIASFDGFRDPLDIGDPD